MTLAGIDPNLFHPNHFEKTNASPVLSPVH